MLSPISQEQALIHFQRALLLERADRIDEAVREYRRALDFNPHLSDARRALASFYRQRGLLLKAADELRAVVADRGDFFTHLQLIELFLEIGRSADALQHVEACLALVPDDACVHRLAAVACLDLGYNELAHRHVRAAIARDPQHWFAYRLLSDCLLHAGDLEGAERALADGRERAPDDHAVAALRACGQVLERHRQVGTPTTVRDRLYAEHGTLYLGSTHCDGTLSHAPGEYYLTFPDLSVTLRRFAYMCQALGWEFDAIAPIDRAAEPLTTVLAGMLQLQVCEARAGQAALLLVGTGTHQLAALALAKARMPAATTFCLASSTAQPHLPDVLGVMAQHGCNLPWEAELQRMRAAGAAPQSISACLQRAARELGDALVNPAPDQALHEIAAYYAALAQAPAASVLV